MGKWGNSKILPNTRCRSDVWKKAQSKLAKEIIMIQVFAFCSPQNNRQFFVFCFNEERGLKVYIGKIWVKHPEACFTGMCGVLKIYCLFYKRKILKIYCLFYKRNNRQLVNTLKRLASRHCCQSKIHKSWNLIQDLKKKLNVTLWGNYQENTTDQLSAILISLALNKLYMMLKLGLNFKPYQTNVTLVKPVNL